MDTSFADLRIVCMTANLLTRKQVVETFKVCAQTIRKWELNGQLVPVRINKRVLRYREEDINKLLQPPAATSPA